MKMVTASTKFHDTFTFYINEGKAAVDFVEISRYWYHSELKPMFTLERYTIVLPE